MVKSHKLRRQTPIRVKSIRKHMHHQRRSNIVNKYIQAEATEEKISTEVKTSTGTQRFDDLQDTGSEEDDDDDEPDSQSEWEDDDEQPNTDDESFIDDSELPPQPDSRAHIGLHTVQPDQVPYMRGLDGVIQRIEARLGISRTDHVFPS